jgi:hypothetical protein
MAEVGKVRWWQRRRMSKCWSDSPGDERPMADVGDLRHDWPMRDYLALLGCLLMVTSATAVSAAQEDARLSAIFGVTEYLPLRAPRTKAADYVREAERVVPAAIKRCGGRDMRYRAATDGAAAVEFTSSTPLPRVRACMVKVLPQVSIEPASQH